MATIQKIEPYQRWTSKDGTRNRTLSVNSVGWHGDAETAWGIALGSDEGAFEMTFEELRAGYEFSERF